MKKQKKKASKRRILFAVVLVVLLFGCIGYLADYYPAEAAALAAFAPADGVTEQVLENGDILLLPNEPAAGLIFYPGGKVEHTAYLPLLRECAARGVLCVLTEMPCRLAVLDMAAAEGIPAAYPEVEEWYIGGHSLGGSMAAAYLADHAEEYAGLVLLGSYSTADLSASGLSVLSVCGSEDTVLDAARYAECLANLPEDTMELLLEGGCHANFGCYGPQEGDGMPTMPREEQIARTAAAILALTEQK